MHRNFGMERPWIKAGRYLLFFILGLNSIDSPGQTDIFEKSKAAYPDELGVFLDRSKLITLLLKDDSLYCSAAVTETLLFLKDQAHQSSNWRVYGSYFSEVEDLEVKTLILENGRYKELKIKDLAKKREDDYSVFYDDSYFYPLSLPAGTAGNRASWSYKETYRDPRFLPSFYFSNYLPDIKGTFVIKASKGIDLSWNTYNDPDKSIHFKQYDKGSFTYYEWTVDNFKAPRHEEDSPKYSYYVPQVVYYVKSYPTKRGPRKVLSGLDDLYNSYLPSISKLQEQPSPDLESVVKSLVAPNDKEIDIARKVFYWVQDHIRYIAFEDGMRGLVPHKPNYIFEKRYGDCKDMASLIVGMLRLAGVKSYYTWIGTRDLPYQYSTLPTPLVDNHMIATFIDENKKYYFLDGTGNYTTIDLPSAMIQGKEALIAFGESGYEIHKVPEVPMESNTKTDSVWVRIDKKSIIGNGTAFFSGYQKVDASYALDKAVEESKKDNVVDWIKKGNNKFYLDSFHIDSLHERDRPLKITYDFKINDYTNEVGDELYLNLNLNKVYYNNYIPADRKVPRENEYKAEFSETYMLSIPDGYMLSYLPPNSEFRGKSLGFEMTYSVKNKSITLKSKVYNNSLMLTPDMFPDWNDSVRALSKAYKETIILKKIAQ